MSGVAAGGPPPRDPDARWRLAVVLSAVLLAVLVLVLVLVRAVSGDDEAPRAAAGGAGTITPATPPREPVRLPERGTFVDAVVQADGTIEVSHWIRAARALDSIIVRVYDSPQVLERPAAVDLEVRTSQGTVTVPDPTIGPEPRVIDLVRPTLLVHLRYTLTGVASLSPSPPGRALLGTVALETSYEGTAGQRRVQVGGRRVLNLVCTPADGGVLDQRPCGTPRDGGWAVNLGPRANRDHLTAQVDLSEAPGDDPDAASATP